MIEIYVILFKLKNPIVECSKVAGQISNYQIIKSGNFKERGEDMAFLLASLLRKPARKVH
jgi:hypothetical protein